MSDAFKKSELLMRSAVKCNKVNCDYCGRSAELTTGDQIYPHRPDLFDKNFWECVKCDAYVGCHPGTASPLGTLASAALRKARSNTHAAFDPLWKPGRSKCFKSRKRAYNWLADKMKIKASDCHIGMFDPATCMIVIHLCSEMHADS